MSATKAEIFDLMRDLAARGYAILFYSTDLAELTNVADRALVLSYGRIAAVLSGDEITEDRILACHDGGRRGGSMSVAFLSRLRAMSGWGAPLRHAHRHLRVRSRCCGRARSPWTSSR